MVIRNQYGVPVKQWRKWSRKARFVFNEVHGSMVGNAWVYQHPAVAANPPKAAHWKTTAWNAAWIAADAADGGEAYGEVQIMEGRREVDRRPLKKAA